jgi:hypothetical protein
MTNDERRTLSVGEVQQLLTFVFRPSSVVDAWGVENGDCDQ